MPFVRIFHARDNREEKVEESSAGIHQAKVKNCGLPDDDPFQAASGDEQAATLISLKCLGSPHSANAANGIRTGEVIANLVETCRENGSFDNGHSNFAPA